MAVKEAMGDATQKMSREPARAFVAPARPVQRKPEDRREPSGDAVFQRILHGVDGDVDRSVDGDRAERASYGRSAVVDAGFGDIVAAARAPSAGMDAATVPQRLPDSTQSMMRDRVGHEFSDVRIYTDARAGAAATAMGAAAFTVGNDVAFAPGRYQPGTPDGQRLLAHELMHVAQGASGASAGVPASAELGGEQDPEEATADAAARLVGWGVRIPPGALASSRARVRRAPETWYRGEVAGAPPAKPGGMLHDLGEGFYLSDSETVAKQYAMLRGKENNAVGRVVSVSIERRELGHVLDLNKDARWQKLIKQRFGNITLEDTLKVTENYSNAFQGFLQQEKITRDQYDAVIGREYLRGGNQLCIWNDEIAQSVRSRLNPIVPAGGIGGGSSGAGGGDEGSESRSSGAKARSDADTAKSEAPPARKPPPEAPPTGKPPPEAPPARKPSETPAPKPAPDATTPRPGVPPAPKPKPTAKATETAGKAAEKAVESTEGAAKATEGSARAATRTPKTGLSRTAAMEAENVAETVSRMQRLLRGFGKAAETFFSLKVQVPLAALMEIVNAVDMINMSMSALAGEGFVLTENIKQAKIVEAEAARALNWYSEGYRTDLHSALSDANMLILLKGSREAGEAVRREAPGIIASLRAFEATWATVLARVRSIKSEAEAKRKIADKLLHSQEFYELTGFSGSSIAATVLGIHEDLIKITGTLGSTDTDLSQLLDMVREDVGIMQFYL